MSTRTATRRDRVSARDIPGARPAPLPVFIKPCLATLRPSPPHDPGWVHEIKHDGYRLQLRIDGGEVRARTRRGYDWSSRFPSLIAAAGALAIEQAILDGEVIVQNARGLSDYALLQDDLGAGRSDRFIYYAFDLLHLDGFDLRNATLMDRKAALQGILAGATHPILFSEHLESEAEATRRRACEMGLEGLVSKRRDAAYRSGRQETWIKIKCAKSDTFPIIAFVEKLGARPRRVASLYIGRRTGHRLVYAGKARSGYTDATARALRERLDPLIRNSSPLSHPIRKPKATWVEPEVLAEVQFSGVTEDGLLREAVFKGLRGDLDEMPRVEAPPLAPARSRGKVRPEHVKKPHVGVPRENILQLLPDAVVPTKDQLARYWTMVWRDALVYLGRRPLKLVRHVHRTTFYHMGRLPPIPETVAPRTRRISDRGPRHLAAGGGRHPAGRVYDRAPPDTAPIARREDSTRTESETAHTSRLDRCNLSASPARAAHRRRGLRDRSRSRLSHEGAPPCRSAHISMPRCSSKRTSTP